MQLKVTFDGTDISAQGSVNTKKYSIQSNLSGQLDNFNSATFEVFQTGYFVGKTPASLQWKRTIIEDLSLPLPVIDNFGRTAANFTGATATPDTGPAWTVSASPASNAQIVSNQLQLTSGAYVSQNTYATNCIINITFVSGTRPALVFRASSAAGTDGFVLYNDSGTTYLKLAASPFTLLASADGAAAGDVMKVYLSDTSITVYRNGVQLFGIINSNYTDNTNVTLLSTYASATGNHVYDTFSATYLNGSTSKRLFAGYSDYARRRPINGIEMGFELACKDSTVLLDRVDAYKTYTNQSDQYIIRDLLTTYFGTLFDTTDISSIGSPGPYFASNYEPVLEAIRRICEITGGRFWIDVDDRAHYTASPIVAVAPFSLSESGTASLTATSRTMKVEDFSHDLSGLLTKVTVIGAVEEQSFTSEQITSNPRDLQTLIPAVSSFRYSSLDYPVFWGYKTDAANSPVDNLAGNSTTTGYANHLMVLYEWEQSNGGGGYDYCNTYSTVNLQAGEMLICSETPTGFETQKYNFEEGVSYGVNVNFAGHAVIYRLSSTYTGDGNCIVTIVPWYGSHLDPFYREKPRLFWIGHGWPCLIDNTSGTASYTTSSSISTAMSQGKTPGAPVGWNPTMPTVPALLPSGGSPHAISYSGPVPIKAIATLDNLRDTYGPIYDGVNHLHFEQTIKDERLTSTQAAKERARIALIERAKGITVGEFSSMWAQGLQTGMLLPITSPTYGAAGFYLITKLSITGLGSGLANYQASFGDYDPEIQDYYLKLNRQKDDSQSSSDARTTQTVSQNYLTTTQQYYNRSGVIYDNAGVLLS